MQLEQDKRRDNARKALRRVESRLGDVKDRIAELEVETRGLHAYCADQRLQALFDAVPDLVGENVSITFVGDRVTLYTNSREDSFAGVTAMLAAGFRESSLVCVDDVGTITQRTYYLD